MSIGPWTFTGFDIAILVLLLVSMLMAMSRGFFRELISIVSLIVGIVVTLFVWGRFQGAAQSVIQPAQLANVVLGAGTFILAYLITSFILSRSAGARDGERVGPMDRLLGAGFGIIRGLVVAALGVMLATADYREAKEIQDMSVSEKMAAQLKVSEWELEAADETLPNAMRKDAGKKAKYWRDMLANENTVELPTMFQGSVFYPVLESIGGMLRALPFAQFKTMAEKLKDGEDLGDVLDTLKDDNEP
jgi:uncharacterized membrane protein required for colicin V production